MFSFLQEEEVEIQFNKYMGDTAGYGFLDHIELNGKAFKQAISSGRSDIVNAYKAVVVHELTHTIQDRINTASNLRGDEREQNTERIWNNAVNAYIKDNPGKTQAELNKLVSNSYGGGGHSKIGSRASERMATTVELNYRNGKGVVSDLGGYVIKELQKEMKGKTYRRKK